MYHGKKESKSMRGLVSTPFIPISKNMSSHRAAQGVIYADQLKRAGYDITVNMSLDLYHEDFNKFDILYVYHGNDWGGSLNLFGGLKEFPHVDNFVNFSKFKGPIVSLNMEFPNYYEQLMHKFDVLKSKNKEYDKRWDEVDFDNILRMEKTATVINTNSLKMYDKVAIGDSHAICMYRPGWLINSIPFKTLHGALNIGLENLLPYDNIDYKEIEFYFGNIDVRHHFLRQENPEQSVKDLVTKYFEQAHALADKYKATIKLYELLPIENERRAIPKTGWFNKTPFYGSWKERNQIRLLFKEECKKHVTKHVQFFEWTSGLINQLGELDFKYMEKPKSVHLSREFYPHWQGLEWNKIEAVKKQNIEDFL
jgi:hypothetical protein